MWYLKGMIFITLLMTIYGQKAYEMPLPEIQIFTKGIRICFPDDTGIDLVAFNANVNNPISIGANNGQISVKLTEPTSKGRWTIIDENFALKAGDQIYYTMYVHKVDPGTSYGLDGHYIVKHVSTKPITTHHYHSCGPDAHRSCIHNLFRKKPKHEATRSEPKIGEIEERFG